MTLLTSHYSNGYSSQKTAVEESTSYCQNCFGDSQNSLLSSYTQLI